MSPKADAARALRDMELEVEAECREWMRRRLEEQLQAEAHYRRRAPAHLRTSFGLVALRNKL